MLVKVYSAAVNGLDVTTVTVEASVEAGQYFYLSGLGDEAVRESLSRIRTSYLYSEYKFPNKGITVNLAPADIRKEGTAFDLPIAVGILAGNGEVIEDHLREFIIVGELGLDGRLQPVRGALPIAIQAKKEGFRGIILPKANAHEAAVVSELEVYGMETLRQVIDLLMENSDAEPLKLDTRQMFYDRQYNFDLDFSDVRGQDKIKRAMEVAAAGGHNMIML